MWRERETPTVNGMYAICGRGDREGQRERFSWHDDLLEANCKLVDMLSRCQSLVENLIYLN